MKKTVVVVKEPPSQFCGKCRLWIETDERHNAFSEIDGVKQRVSLWLCPECRGEAKPGEPVVEAPRGAKTQADVVKEEKYGPLRRIAEVIGEGSATTAKGRLECGHECAVPRGATFYRCRKCRKKGEVT